MLKRPPDTLDAALATSTGRTHGQGFEPERPGITVAIRMTRYAPS